jgi:hypothetical protein
VDDRCSERAADVLDVAAHRPAVERDALVHQVLLEPVVRHAERELRRDHVRDRRRVKQRPRKQRLGAGHRLHRRFPVADHLVLGDPLDQDREAAAPEHQLLAVLEPDPPAPARLALIVEDLDQNARQLADAEVAAALGRGARPWRRLGLGLDRVLGLADRVVEILLQLGLAGEQVAQREL